MDTCGSVARGVIMSVHRRGTDELTQAIRHINALFLTYRPTKMTIHVICLHMCALWLH